MQNPRNVFGNDSDKNNNSNSNNNNNYHRALRGFQPMTPAPQNAGLNPRYVPPQRRDMYENDPTIRPESSMSNASFATQFPQGHGGVSLNNLTSGANGGTPSVFGNQDGNFGPGYGGPAGPGPGANMYGNSGNFAGYSQNPGNFGPPSTAPIGQPPSPYGMVPGGYGQSFGGFGPGPGGYGSPPSSASTQALGGHGHQNFNNGGYGADRSRQASDSTAHDSVRGSGTGKAFNLAHVIKSGATDSPDDQGLEAHGGDRRKVARQPAPAKPQPDHKRSTTDALMVSANPINAGRVGNIKGNAAAYVGAQVTAPPDWFARTKFGFKPTVEEIFYILPVIEPCRYAAPSSAGVMRIRNIPYGTTRSEVTAFVGRNAQVISQPPGSPFFATHIVMERHTGKTMDAFVEFDRPAEATWVVNQFQKRIEAGRHPKIGDRLVEVEISSQTELMSELFPRVKNVTWEGNSPNVLHKHEMYYEGVTATGFAGFLQHEEIVMVVKHAETPHRSAFVDRNIVRVYESWISTLHKYPWFAHNSVLMTERRLIFDATLSLFRHLVAVLRRMPSRSSDNTKPTTSTLQELAIAALTCPGFSELQKASIVTCMTEAGFEGMTTGKAMNLKLGGNTALAKAWPFQVLARAPSASNEIMNYFASLMHDATNGDAQQMSLADLHAMRASGGTKGGPFGTLTINYGDAKTIADVGKIELRKVEELLKKVLPSTRSNSHNSA